LLFIAAIHDRYQREWAPSTSAVELIEELTAPHRNRWKVDLVERPDVLFDQVCDLLVSLRLAEVRSELEPAVRLLAGAARFRVVIERRPGDGEQLGLL